MIDRIRHALITDGDTGVIGEGDGALILCGTDDGGGFGFVRGTGFYYMQAGFDVKGRA